MAIFACSLVLGIAGVVIKRSFGFSLEVSLGTGVVESTVNANFEPVAGGVEIVGQEEKVMVASTA